MPTTVIDMLAGLNVAEAVFLALMLFGSGAAVLLLLVDVALADFVPRRLLVSRPVVRLLVEVVRAKGSVRIARDRTRRVLVAWLMALALHLETTAPKDGTR